MAELGEGSEALHAQIGERARQTGVTALWTVGRLSQHASRAFGEGARHFSDQAALIEGLQQALSERDQQGPLQVLVKGSRSSAMEHVVEIGRASCRERVCQYV